MTEREPTYTLAEAEFILVVKACASDGHRPVLFSLGMGALCKCGQYRWKGEKV